MKDWQAWVIIQEAARLELEQLFEAMAEYVHRWESVSKSGTPQPLMMSVKRRIRRAVVGR